MLLTGFASTVSCWNLCASPPAPIFEAFTVATVAALATGSARYSLMCHFLFNLHALAYSGVAWLTGVYRGLGACG